MWKAPLIIHPRKKDILIAGFAELPGVILLRTVLTARHIRSLRLRDRDRPALRV
jgi:hypothetical protein